MNFSVEPCTSHSVNATTDCVVLILNPGLNSAYYCTMLLGKAETNNVSLFGIVTIRNDKKQSLPVVSLSQTHTPLATRSYSVSLQFLPPNFYCPVGWGCRIHRPHLCRGVRPPPMSVLDMTLNKLMVRFQ